METKQLQDTEKRVHKLEEEKNKLKDQKERLESDAKNAEANPLLDRNFDKAEDIRSTELPKVITDLDKVTNKLIPALEERDKLQSDVEERARWLQELTQVLEAEAKAAQGYTYDIPPRTDDIPTVNPGLFFVPRP